MHHPRTNRRRRNRVGLLGAIAALVCSVALTSAAIAVATPPTAQQALRAEGMSVIAHRGAAATAPENTLSSIAAGLASDADFVEIDLRLTRDNVAVLMHDSKVDRTTDGSGKVSSLRYRDIQRLDAGSWFGPAFRGERVPTFDEFLEVFLPERALAFVELKGVWQAPQIEALLARVAELDATPRIVLQSFDQETLRRVVAINPEVAVVALTKVIDDDLVAFIAELGLDGIGAPLELIEQHQARIAELDALGVATFAYTLNDEIAWQAAAEAGVDLIVTDTVDELQRWLTR